MRNSTTCTLTTQGLAVQYTSSTKTKFEMQHCRQLKARTLKQLGLDEVRRGESVELMTENYHPFLRKVERSMKASKDLNRKIKTNPRNFSHLE